MAETVDYSWGRMTPKERRDAETRGRWTDGRCRRCVWHDHYNHCCSYLTYTGHPRRKPEKYGGRCPEFRQRKTSRHNRVRPYGRVETIDQRK